jgi:hypothetical protein
LPADRILERNADDRYGTLYDKGRGWEDNSQVPPVALDVPTQEGDHRCIVDIDLTFEKLLKSLTQSMGITNPDAQMEVPHLRLGDQWPRFRHAFRGEE